jgi:hypothetical protein
LAVLCIDDIPTAEVLEVRITRAILQAVAEEREACAAVADTMWHHDVCAGSCAAAIRARSVQP